MLKVGITGTIGSGKSTVCRVFETLGVPVYYADNQAKRILDYPIVHAKLEQCFGKDIFNGDHVIDRQELARVVFSDDKKLASLNSIIHPLVKKDFDCWLTLQHGKPYVLHEAAILLESGFGPFFSKIIVVIAPEALRMKRVGERDKLREAEFRQRSLRQWTEKEKLKCADYVINNDETQLLIPQVLSVHKKILELL